MFGAKLWHDSFVVCLESEVIPFLDCSWSKVSKNVQDFDNWIKIGWVIDPKPRTGQLQNSLRHGSIYGAVVVPKR